MTTTTQPVDGPSTTLEPAPAGALRPRGVAAARLLYGEFLKIWTTNTWWIMAILAIAYTGLSLTANLFQANAELDHAKATIGQDMPQFGGTGPDGQPIDGGPPPAEVARMQAEWRLAHDISRVLATNAANVFTSGQFFGLLFMVILGALIVTNEYYHQTATTTFLTTPHRTQVIASKLAAAVLLAAAFWAVTTVINISIGSAVFANGDYSASLTQWPIIRSVLMNLLAYGLWAVLGVGFGVLIRSQLGATLTASALYMLSFPVAFIFFGLLRQFVFKGDWIFNWMVIVPGVASSVMISPDRIQLGPILGPIWWSGALILLAYGLIAGAVGTLITRKRDIS